MPRALGIGIGSVDAVAAVAANESDAAVLTRRAALHLGPDGVPLLGEKPSDPAYVSVSGFADRVGDPVGILADDGATYSGEDIMATAVNCLIHAAHDAHPELSGDAPVTVVHPTVWQRYTVGALDTALVNAGVDGARLVTEADAITAWLEHNHGPQTDGLSVIYDLGGTSLDITLMGHGDPTSSDAAGVLGKPIRTEEFGGTQFDHAVTRYVLGNVVDGFGDVDLSSPEAVEALTELRARCRAAKETLSTDTETTITIDLPGVSSEVRLVRSELEELVREPIMASVTLVRESLSSAGIDLGDVRRVVLAGGSSAIPLVAELLSAELRVPVVASEHPAHTAVIGGALLAAQQTTATVPAAGDIDNDDTAIIPVAPTAAAAAAAPLPPVSSPPVLAAASTPDGAVNRAKKTGFVFAAAAAVVVLAAGGLALGTATENSPERATTTVTDAGTTTSAGATTTENGTPTTGSTDSLRDRTDGATVARATTTRGGPGTPAAPAGNTAPDGAPTQDAAGAPVPEGSPDAPAPQAPPAPGNPAPAPAPAPAPDPAPSGGPPQYHNVPAPSLDGGGYIGDTVDGVGDGLGGVVGGVGDGVGGLLGGVGDAVGGVTGNGG